MQRRWKKKIVRAEQIYIWAVLKLTKLLFFGLATPPSLDGFKLPGVRVVNNGRKSWDSSADAQISENLS